MQIKYGIDSMIDDITINKGDIYKLGKHYIMCGDSTNEEDVRKLLNGNIANMVFTDPPYSQKYQSNMRKIKFNKIKNDDKIIDFFPMIKKYNKGFVYICTSWKVVNKWINLFTKYYNLTNMIIWYKACGGMGDLKKTFSTDYEIILCSNNNNNIVGKRIGSVWQIKKDNGRKYIHPTQKPVKLISTAIEHSTNENDIVLDLFGGSGSTIMACEELNRICYTMELDENYVKAIINRYIKETGKEVIKI